MSAFEIVEGQNLHWVPRVWSWCHKFRNRVFDDYAPDDVTAFTVAMVKRLNSFSAHAYWIAKGDDVGGLVLLEIVRPGVAETHILFKRAMWGSAITLESVRQIYAQFFLEFPTIRRLESRVFADNSAIIGLARKLGARDEGTMREYTMRNGKPADMVSLGLLRSEFKG